MVSSSLRAIQKFCYWCLTPKTHSQDIFSYLPGPYNASAACGCALLARSTCRVVGFVISSVRKWSEGSAGSAGSELLSVLLETFLPWGIGVAWPLLISKSLRFIDFVLVLGLISCERCMSSVTAKPRSAWGAQRRNVVWTHHNFSSPKTAVAIRKAMTLHQQDSRTSLRETQSKDLTTEG